MSTEVWKELAQLVAVLLAITALVWLTACAPPKLVDVMPKDGVKCKAEITMPDELPRGRESIEVKVRIFSCVE